MSCAGFANMLIGDWRSRFVMTGRGEERGDGRTIDHCIELSIAISIDQLT